VLKPANCVLVFAEYPIRMKIVHINIADRTGGPGRAIYWLHCAMIDRGLESNLLVQNQSGDGYPNVQRVSKLEEKLLGPFRYKLLDKIVGKTNKSLGLFNYALFGANIIKHPALSGSDVIYLHWINHGFLSLGTIEKILQIGRPVFWFMHDMWPITGGCHYSFDCSRYSIQCTYCPFFLKPRKNDLAKKQFNDKMRIFSRYSNLSFIAPSKWLAECARLSALAKGHTVYHIPHLINTDLYKPCNKKFARQVLGLKPDTKYILFGAVSATTNP
jgi:hypothetical protein